MENVKLVFNGTDFSNTSNNELECYANGAGEICISIQDGIDYIDNYQNICLNKSTAVRLSKELKKQIGSIS